MAYLPRICRFAKQHLALTQHWATPPRRPDPASASTSALSSGHRQGGDASDRTGKPHAYLGLVDLVWWAGRITMRNHDVLVAGEPLLVRLPWSRANKGVR